MRLMWRIVYVVGHRPPVAGWESDENKIIFCFSIKLFFLLVIKKILKIIFVLSLLIRSSFYFLFCLLTSNFEKSLILSLKKDVRKGAFFSLFKSVFGVLL